MSSKISSIEEKSVELQKFRDLVLAAIDYHLEDATNRIKTEDFDSHEHYESLKKQTIEHFKEGRLTKLKQWFKNLIEGVIEAGDLKFNKYLQNKTGYDINVFEDFFKRVESITEKGQITTDNQFYDISIMVDQLCTEQILHNEKIQTLNHLLRTYENGKSKTRR